MQKNLKFTAHISATEMVARGVKKIAFKIDQPFEFLPWQYVWVELPNLKYPDPKGSRRAFSKLNATNENNSIEIVVRASDSGYKKTLFELAVGDEVLIHGPFGNSFILTDEHQPSNVVMIAGGVGIAVFLPMLKTVRDKRWPIKCFLVYINSDPESTPFLKELEDLKKGWVFFDYKVKYEHFSREEVKDASENIHGNVEWWIAGPKGMVNQTFMELSNAGISKTDMVFENYYPTPDNSLTIEKVNAQLSENQLFATALQESTSHSVITDTEGVVLFANKAAETITGYSRQEIVGNTARLWGGVMSHDFYVEFWKGLKSGKPFEGRFTNRRKNGEIYTAIAHITPITDEKRTIVGFISTEEDITKMVALENQLTLDRNIDESLLLSMGEGMVTLDKDGKVIMINEAATRMLGFGKEELAGKSFIEIVKAESVSGKVLSPTERPLLIAAKSLKPFVGQLNYIRKDGTNFYSGITITPVYVDHNYYGEIQVFKDITKEIEVDRAKTEFVSIASHQLRTPLTAIKWFCEILLGETSKNLTPDQLDNIKSLATSNQRMIDLVNSLLNISRIESGRIIIDPRPTEIGKLVNDIVQELAEEVSRKKQKMEVTIQKDLPIINLDPSLIHEVYVNLLKNAMKYTPDGGEIQITVVQKGNDLLSEIKDNGYGIPESNKPHIFTRFFRAENALKIDPNGTGLGLYLVKSIIDSSKGKIWFESVEGKGSIFYFTIPIGGMDKKEGSVKLS